MTTVGMDSKKPIVRCLQYSDTTKVSCFLSSAEFVKSKLRDDIYFQRYCLRIFCTVCKIFAHIFPMRTNLISTVLISSIWKRRRYLPKLIMNSEDDLIKKSKR